MVPLHTVPIPRGRASECETLDRLLEGVRTRRSQVLVLRGESGIGKTTLLDYVGARASGCRVVRAAGIESEMELAYAGLHQLCTPMLDRLRYLPGPQHDALATTFGMSTGTAPDRFRVSVAALGLLSASAEKQPLVCLIDDAQWLDRASAQVLAFVSRRLLAESVALVFAVREPSHERALAGLPVMTVGGLSDGDARALLASAVPGRLDVRVRDRIVAETRGNPLALLELPRGLSAADLAGGFARPDAQPLVTRIEQRFLGRVRSLPAETQRLLLAAAAEPVGDVSLLMRAAGRLGLDVDAAAPAEAAGLIELGARGVRFRHPLVRSAAYRAATASDRRDVHRALAEATDPEADPDRRAWHRANAAVGPDEDIADALERSADRAQARGGIAAAAAFLQRATDLTPDPARRAARALAAARAKFEAGDANAANELLTAAESGPLDGLQRARLVRLRAQIAFAQRRGSDAPQLLLRAARGLEGLDVGMARETYLEAFAAAIFAGRLARHVGLREVATAARSAPRPAVPARPIDLLMDGLATRFIDGYAAGVPALRQALRAIAAEAPSHERDLRWLWLTSPIAFEVWDHEAWDQLTAKAVAVSRQLGALAVLRIALAYRAGVCILAGDLTDASALLEESDALSVATGHVTVARYARDLLAAWQGDESRLLHQLADVESVTNRGEGRVLGVIGHVTALLYNGLGRYEAARTAARQACEYEDPGIFGQSLTELIEAAARSGARAVAQDALRQLEARTVASGTDWALGLLARSRALLSDGPATDALYTEAIDRLGRTRVVVHLARAHLVYGEWLRRENRRVEARAQLRTAHEMLSRVGANGFAERAKGELLATGETVHKRTAGAPTQLTAQEVQVARLAAEGNTNPEIGSQLFISPRTAEYHLRKVFAKLGITSRRALRNALRDPAPGRARE